jgi:hypothetical protein
MKRTRRIATERAFNPSSVGFAATFSRKGRRLA